MKYLISKSHLKLLKEQYPRLNAASTPASGGIAQSPNPNYTGKKIGDGFGNLEQNLISIKNFLLNKQPEKLKKLRLIFPLSGWEKVGLNLLKKFGVITEWFNSLYGALKVVDDLKTKNVKVDELVIGSHGGGESLLMTKNETYRFNNEFLESMKGIIHSNTKVFFTACHGADYLDGLKDAAERLNVGTYGSAGLYNYITNTSEKGFYWCSPKQIKISNNYGPIENPVEYAGATNGTIPGRHGYIMVKYFSDNEQNIDGFITIKDGVLDTEKYARMYPETKNLLKNKIPFKTEHFSSLSISTSNYRKDIFFVMKLIDVYYVIGSYFEKIISGLIKKEEKKFGSIEKFMDYLIEQVKKNNIIIELNIKGKLTNIKNLPKIQEPKPIDNEFLLKNGYCKQVSSIPISWVNPLS